MRRHEARLWGYTTEPARGLSSTHEDKSPGRQGGAAGDLVDVPRLVTAYYSEVPDAGMPWQRVAFGTSGHRGSAFEHSFKEWHVLAISQAICQYRKRRDIDGPLFLGIDTHALYCGVSRGRPH